MSAKLPELAYKQAIMATRASGEKICGHPVTKKMFVAIVI